MHQHFFSTLATCLAMIAGRAFAQDITTDSVSIVSVSGCPAVVSTTDICTTCMTAACVLEATITAGCDGCSDVPPTVYRSFPCDQGCTSLGCKTVYTVVTASGSACSVAATQTQDDAGVETATSTVTETVVVSPTLTTQPDTSAASPTTAQADTDAASSVSTQTDTAVATLTTTTTIDAGAESSTKAQGDSIKTSEGSKAVASTAGAARLVARFLLW